MRQIFGFFTGILIGWLVGSAIALLLAPSTGEELRVEIRGRSAGVVDEIKGAARARHAQLEKRLAVLRAPRPSATDE